MLKKIINFKKSGIVPPNLMNTHSFNIHPFPLTNTEQIETSIRDNPSEVLGEHHYVTVNIVLCF
jgi:hypothetical protein